MLTWAVLGLAFLGLTIALAKLARHGGVVTHVFTNTLLWCLLQRKPSA
jgi:hypothetical protein